MSGHRARNWRNWSFCIVCRIRRLPRLKQLSAPRPLSLRGTTNRAGEPSGNGWKRRCGVLAMNNDCRNLSPSRLFPAFPCGMAYHCPGTASSDSARGNLPGTVTASACILKRQYAFPLLLAVLHISASAFLWQRRRIHFPACLPSDCLSGQSPDSQRWTCVEVGKMRPGSSRPFFSIHSSSFGASGTEAYCSVLGREGACVYYI